MPYDMVIPPLDTYPKKTIVQKDICTPRLTATLFKIAQIWEQLKYPLIDKWIKEI